MFRSLVVLLSLTTVAHAQSVPFSQLPTPTSKMSTKPLLLLSSRHNTNHGISRVAGVIGVNAFKLGPRHPI